MKSADAEQSMGKSDVMEKLGSLCRVIEAETGEYQALLALLSKQRQAAVEARFGRFADVTEEKDALLKSLRGLEHERSQLMKGLSGALQAGPDEISVSRLIALMPGPEADQLNACRYRLQAVIEQIRVNNKTNQNLLRHLLELKKKSIDVLGGNLPGKQTYRENGRVQTIKRTGTPVQGHISFEV